MLRPVAYICDGSESAASLAERERQRQDHSVGCVASEDVPRPSIRERTSAIAEDDVARNHSVRGARGGRHTGENVVADDVATDDDAADGAVVALFNRNAVTTIRSHGVPRDGYRLHDPDASEAVSPGVLEEPDTVAGARDDRIADDSATADVNVHSRDPGDLIVADGDPLLPAATDCVALD